MQEIVTQSRNESWARACELAARACTEAGRCVLLVPTYDDQVRMKHFLAERGCGFGVSVETPKSWVADLWQMHGDGRVMAGSVDRALYVRLALKEYLEGFAGKGAASQRGGRADGGGVDANDSAAVAAGDSAAGPGGPGRPLLEMTPGTERLLARLVRMAPGEVIAADKDPQAYGLSPAQRTVVAVAARARRTMARAGFAEHARACDYLAQERAVEGLRVVALDIETLCAEDRLLASTDACMVRTVAETGRDETRAPELNELVTALYRPDFDHPVAATGAVCFAYPAGEYSSNHLICGEVARLAEEAAPDDPGLVRVAVVAPDALGTFEALAPRLLKAGASVSASGMVAFPKTPFGRAWTALLEFVLDPEHPSVLRAGDFALSAFSSMDVRQAYGLDARLRGWRGETVDDALTDMTAWANEDWRAFLSCVAEGDYIGALDAQKRWVGTRMRWSEAYRLAQLRVIEGALAVHERAEGLGLSPSDALEVLHELLMPYETQVEPDGNVRFEVRIGTLAQMALEPASSYDIVAIADLDANHYPLKDEETSVDALLQALGVWKPARRVEKLRLRFASSVALARRDLLLHRVLNTVDADELRPSALIEELVDCYRRDPRNAEEIDKVTGLPPALEEHCATLGEEDLARAIDPEGAPAPLDERVEVFSSGYLQLGEEAHVLVPSRNEEGELLPWPVLSPSAIEKYLECPYKWFADRRLRLSGIDAELGPIAYGNFAHAVLERLHGQLRVTGLRRVTPENIGECVCLLDGIFEKMLKDQLLEYDANALIPLTPLEAIEVDAFHRDLQEYLRFEANLLPDFEPYKQELKFGWDEPFEYAGMKIRGSIDRVDVDMGGRAVVLDYKNSVGPNYCFWPKDDKVAKGDAKNSQNQGDERFAKGAPAAQGDESWVGPWGLDEGQHAGDLPAIALPRKMQTLIYAQVVRRKLGLVPVGALYVAYGKKSGIAGLYDQLALNALTDLPGIDGKRCGTTEMLDVLDRCEEMVAARLHALAAGDIEPAPCDADACDFCPVVQCTVRDGLTREGAM